MQNLKQGNRYIKKGGKLFPCSSSVNTSTFFDLAPEEEVVNVIHKLCASIVLEYDFSFVTKSGFGVRPAEAEAMRLISKYTSVPAPEVYHTNFSSEYKGAIEMSLIQGFSLEKTWDTMDENNKESICHQTWNFVSEIRTVPSPHDDPLLEDLRARIYERYLYFGVRRYEHELPDMLPRSDRAVFTHGDIAPRNIMVDENTNITGIIDWEYAGWYPDHWEYAQILRLALWGDWSIWMENNIRRSNDRQYIGPDKRGKSFD
ncbi:kinase-like domain-containing protein [Aspergillus parasiticus]|uniref:Kinase-like domain-containing protein n=1 Tax=Aspergillus parasiticus TaxID=5067 RepID=A0A5N6E170_ASPPA|nr:kinase-like domain-containing protein [Aspergillus parasiticus]